jgi:hypothetical protein
VAPSASVHADSRKKDAEQLLEYLVILMITVAGMMQLPWIAMPLGACILALLPFVERAVAPVGSSTRTNYTIFGPVPSVAALLNGVMAASAAFL